jgi:hypothetical protein
VLTFDELTDKQKFFIWSSGVFTSMVLGDNEFLATKTLDTIRASTHLMHDQEWEDLGKYLTENLKNYANSLLEDENDNEGDSGD